MEDAREVARDVGILPGPDQIAGAHEHTRVVGVTEQHRQPELEDQADRKDAAGRARRAIAAILRTAGSAREIRAS